MDTEIFDFLMGLECGVNLEHPKVMRFTNYDDSLSTADALYTARLWGKEPSTQVEGITPHKRIRHLAIIPHTAFDGDDLSIVNAIYTSKNKVAIPWGCWNRENQFIYIVKDGYRPDGTLRFKEIQYVLATDCKHTNEFPEDPACGGCKHKRG